MADRVTKLAVFTIADFKEEERWLREKAREGLRFVRMIVPCFYVFERVEPEDVIYRLDFRDAQEGADYEGMLADFGWESCGHCMGWGYWRRRVSQDDEGGEELFSDDESRLSMVKRVLQTRLLPLMTIFLCCVLPGLLRAINGELYGASRFFLGFFGLMAALYIYLFVHCGGKLLRMRRELEKKE